MSKVMQFIKKNSLGWFLILPVLLCLILIKWYPIVEGVTKSFYASRGYEMTEFVGLDNYIDVFSDTLFMKTLFNTVKYVLFSLVIGVIPPILIAFLLNEVKFINKFRVAGRCFVTAGHKNAEHNYYQVFFQRCHLQINLHLIYHILSNNAIF